MSNIKRILSAFLALTIVLGTMSCLGTVFASAATISFTTTNVAETVEAYSDEDDTVLGVANYKGSQDHEFWDTYSSYTKTQFDALKQSSTVKTIAQLDSEYSGSYAYIGVEFYEMLTDSDKITTLANKYDEEAVEYEEVDGEEVEVNKTTMSYYLDASGYMGTVDLAEFGIGTGTTKFYATEGDEIGDGYAYWFPTDHYVEADQELIAVFYLKTSEDLFYKSMDVYADFTRSFFDVTDGEATTATSTTTYYTQDGLPNKYSNAQDMEGMANDGHPALYDVLDREYFDHDPTDEDMEDEEYTTYDTDFSSNTYFDTFAGTATGKYIKYNKTKKTWTSNNSLAVTENIKRDIVHLSNALLFDGTALQSPMHYDDFVAALNIKVRADLADETIGVVSMDLDNVKANGFAVGFVNYTRTEGILSDISDADFFSGDLYSGETLDISGLYHVFMIGEAPESGDEPGGEETEEYTITYVTDGTAVEDATVAEGADLPEATTTKTGYEFTGWTYTATDGGAAYSGSTMPAYNLTATANWSVKSYTITYAVGGGSAVADESVQYGADLPEATSEKSGYILTGWAYTKTADGTAYTGSTMPAYDLTATAQWTESAATKYTITYVTDGTSVGDKQVEEGATLPTATTTKTGYTFDKWVYTATTGGAAYSGSTMPAYDLTATATWTANKHTVTFVLNNGSADDVHTNVEYGTTLSTITPAPEKEGYTFKAWTPAVDATMPDNDVTYTATWTANNYTITFDLAGGDGTFEDITAAYESNITWPTATPTREGYTFTGWSTGTLTTMPLNGATATAQWTINTYTIKYVTDGTSVDDDTVEYSALIPTDRTSAKDGSVFGGWTYTKTADGTVYTGTTMPAYNLTATAKWAAATHTITYVTDGTPVADATVAEGAALPTAVSTKEGYENATWTYTDANGVEYEGTTMPTYDLTATATFVPKEYTITFDLAGGDGTFEAITAAYNAEITWPTAEPTKTGYTFTGWSVGPYTTMPLNGATATAQWTINTYKLTFVLDNGSDDVVYNEVAYNTTLSTYIPTGFTKTGNTFNGWYPSVDATMPAADTTYTAQWTVDTLSINFNVKGGTPVNSITAEFGTPISKPDDPTKTGYTFAGWYEDEACEGAEYVFPETMPENTVNLYAKWNINHYTITYVFDNGTENYSKEYEYGATPDAAPENPTKTGYTFKAWDKTTPKKVTEDLTITATYTINSYKVIYVLDNGEDNIEQTVEYNATIGAAPANPSKEGYTFTSWDNDVVGTAMPANNITVTAQYDINSYDIVFYNEGNDYETMEAVTYGEPLEEYVPEEPESEGQTFSNWKYYNFETGEAYTGTTMPDFKLKAVAQYDVESYKITYSVDGGDEVDDAEVAFGDPLPTATTSKTGYTFNKWNYVKAGTTEAYTGTTMPAYDLEATADYTINQYKVIFKLSDDDADPFVLTKDYNAAITADDYSAVVTAKEGYTFTGWYPAVPANMPVTEDGYVTVAQYKVNSHLVTFKDGDTVYQSGKVNYGEAVAYTGNTPTKVGYAFDGWNEEIPEKMVDNDLVFTAKWTAKKFDAKFYANEGDAEAFYTAEDVEFNTTFAAPETAPEKNTYEFKGWKLAGTTEAAAFPYTMNAEGLTFYAIWEQDATACRVQKVERITENYFTKGLAQYEITLADGVTTNNIYFVDGDKTVSFSKPSFRSIGTDSGVISITEATATTPEIWVVEAVLAEGNYTAYVKADVADVPRDFTVAYDKKEAEDIVADVTSVTYPEATVIKGNTLTWTIVTSTDVNWIKLTDKYTGRQSGTTKTVSSIYKYCNTGSNLTVTDNAGVRTWVITAKANFSTDDSIVDMKWSVYYKTSTATAYTLYNETAYDVVCGETNDDINPVSETYDPYTLISVAGPKTVAATGTRAEVTITTTTDCTKVRIGYNNGTSMKYTTFQTTSTNVTYTDNEETGVRTWTINYKFAAEGSVDFTVNARGTAWGEGQNFTTVIG